jgi:hypothetical protein
MSRYLRRQSIVGLVGNALRIYRRDFGVLFVAGATLDIPFAVAADLAFAREGLGISWIALMFLYLCVSSVSSGIMTVLVSDVCLGNVPRIRRAYSRVFDRRFWTFFGTVMLANALIVAGLILPIGLFILVPPIVILEGLSGRPALARSLRLGRGYYLRSFAIVIGIIVLEIWMDGQLYPLLGRLLPATGWGAQAVAELLESSVTALVNVLMAILVVLIYYDLRARKEAYDSLALAEDLRR